MANNAVGDVLIIGAVGVVGYLLYKAITAVEQPISAAAGAVSSGVTAAETGAATAYVAATSPTIIPTGNVVLPNGTVLSVASLSGNITMDDSTNQALFTYQGVSYAIQGGTGAAGSTYDASGNYIATQVS
jgi:hypothetical protein